MAATPAADPRGGSPARRRLVALSPRPSGAFPFSQGSQRLTAPLLGWEQALVKAASQSWDVRIDTTQLGQAAVPLIVAVGIAILVGAIYALRLRSVVDPAFLVLAGLYACGAATAFQYPKDLIRELALVLVLLPFVLAAFPATTLRTNSRISSTASLPPP